ncbi:plasmid replication protein RepC [Sagittula salina]|uniref:Replication initiator RepC n=1 Tax=Sagittula salina TaxID=2820268 RepID=A0A940MS63_9RHOB|nr:plasmid replication protein RepC [Sagittula salina]MBP0484419.1 replication initiator RepC [Sagittula salina]
MTELSRIRVGQPVETCPKPGPCPADKWALLDALTHAASDFGLGHRTLTVLRALLSFFPHRALPADPGGAVVYPSNRTLSERLNGMPESTLRRHLGTLVRSGLVNRQDSANRKRFARFGGVAFGFDLSPLARCAESLLAAAECARERRDRVAALRALIAATRQQLLDDGCDTGDPLLEEARLSLRRKLSPDTLETLLNALDKRLTTRLPSVEMSACDNRNERHIQDTEDSESVYQNTRFRDRGPEAHTPPALSEVLESCHEYRGFFPGTPSDWPGLESIVRRLHPMLGIDAQVFEEARTAMGSERAVAVVLCMLETLEGIHRPGAYLRGLARRAAEGRFNMPGMLMAARKRRESMQGAMAIAG